MIGFPFDSHVTFDAEGTPFYDRAISSAPYRKLLKELFKTGIMPTPSTNMQVTTAEGMNVTVLSGFAMVEGCMKLEEDERTLAVQASSSQYDRIDTVVLRLDDNDNVRICDFYVVEGTPSANPVRPDLTREGSIYEIGLADIFVGKNSTQISASKITDTRYEDERCGVVSSVSEFDTETLNQQMNGWAKEQREAFEEWVKSIKDILDESTAGHLQNEIDDVKKDVQTNADEISALNTSLLQVSTYVGEDKKLHFTDAQGVDHVLPFNSGYQLKTGSLKDKANTTRDIDTGLSNIVLFLAIANSINTNVASVYGTMALWKNDKPNTYQVGTVNGSGRGFQTALLGSATGSYTYIINSVNDGIVNVKTGALSSGQTELQWYAFGEE